MFKVSKEKLRYTQKPQNRDAYTKKMDRIYTKYTKAYGGFIAVFPLWKYWLRCVLPYIKGSNIIDISFGPAYLFTKLPADKNLYGLDYNETMVRRARAKMQKRNINVDIRKGNVENMPYPDSFFDTVINTMAFSGYPDGETAINEMLRVLKYDGTLLILDYDYPQNRNIFGYWVVKLIEKSGDIIRDIGKLIDSTGCNYTRKKIGGFGSIQLFVITRSQPEKIRLTAKDSNSADQSLHCADSAGK
ncbi:MAG: class I SAM-dependent methyltransferase [Clostridia bacterium]|mgnify:CR=1 FL=1|jgi:ubiquinone/menaquinone biosynthesis C-methylase UbiE|nr:class I SAM-dependent methyltransferase [Clostridia bacterium]MBT7123052.1 class I SAM-dependent methyltransferase [Clostridia bacterium]